MKRIVVGNSSGNFKNVEMTTEKVYWSQPIPAKNKQRQHIKEFLAENDVSGVLSVQQKVENTASKKQLISMENNGLTLDKLDLKMLPKEVVMDFYQEISKINMKLNRRFGVFLTDVKSENVTFKFDKFGKIHLTLIDVTLSLEFTSSYNAPKHLALRSKNHSPARAKYWNSYEMILGYLDLFHREITAPYLLALQKIQESDNLSTTEKQDESFIALEKFLNDSKTTQVLDSVYIKQGGAKAIKKYLLQKILPHDLPAYHQLGA